MFMLTCFAILGYTLIWIPHTRSTPAPKAARKATVPVETAMIIDLATAVIASGASIPNALHALDQALAEEGEASGLGAVSRLLLMGASWNEAWRDAPERFSPLREALEPSWAAGAAPIPLLERASSSLRASRARASREAAAALAAKLVLPLGLCFLPAFVLLGVLPVVVSTGANVLG